MAYQVLREFLGPDSTPVRLLNTPQGCSLEVSGDRTPVTAGLAQVIIGTHSNTLARGFETFGPGKSSVPAWLKEQVDPDGLSVMLDLTTARDSLNSLDAPDVFTLLDLSAIAAAAAFYDEIILQPSSHEWDAPSELGFKVLTYDSKVGVPAELHSIYAKQVNQLGHEHFRKSIEDAWSEFYGRRETIYPNACSSYQSSPPYWDGIVASYFKESIETRDSTFLAIQTVRTMFNSQLASELGLPYIASSMRTPIVEVIANMSRRLELLVLDVLLPKMQPSTNSTPSNSGAVAREWRSPFIFGLVLNRMKRPEDFLPVVRDLRAEFAPVRKRLRKDREKWVGNAANYAERVLRELDRDIAKAITAGADQSLDQSVRFQSANLNTITPALTPVAFVVAAVAKSTWSPIREHAFRRWLRPELFILGRARRQAMQLLSLNNRIKSIWRSDISNGQLAALEKLAISLPREGLRPS
ncbi:hypothetical protein ACIBO2_24365 [Nonomuraea sp. NPDC050022]|uniref:hypothetical protein n=1 Tax=Nonomuraea sp. NPDC050022 TaxID=3364358 RepID=UPI0037A08AE9